MAAHNELGKQGEALARDFVISKGFIIREQNWRMDNLEIDIVAEEPDKGLLHIVEVKTRTSDEHFKPMDAITRKKQSNLINAANGYIRYYRLRLGIQYDVIFVIGKPGAQTIQFIPKAFQPRLRTYR